MIRLEPATPAGDLLARELEELGCEALLVLASSSRDPDLAPFVGRVHLTESFLLVPGGGVPHLGFWSPLEEREAAATGLVLLDPEELELPRLAPRISDPGRLLAAVVARACERAGVAPGRLALAGRAPAGQVHAACRRLEQHGYDFISGHGSVLRLRKSKGEAEVAQVRRAAAAAGAALRRVAELLAAAVPRDGELWLGGERLRVGRLAAEVAVTLARGGVEQPAGNLIGPGEEGAVPHTAGTPERVLSPGESLVVDLFPRDRLFADCTRTFCVGEPPAPLRGAHGVVLETLERVRRRVRPGVRGWDLELAASGRFSAAGYPTRLSHPGTLLGYIHNLGHGVGWELHEHPVFTKTAGAEGRLEVGDVFTLEPGLYDPGAGWAVRLEDLIHLGPAGPETLTPLPYELDPRAWLADAQG